MIQNIKKVKIKFVLGVINLAISVISHFNWPTLTIGLNISIAPPFGVPLVYKHILPLIQSAFLMPKQTLSINKIPRTGDIITFDYHNLPHEGVVSKVQWERIRHNKNQSNHYAFSMAWFVRDLHCY